jgi:hypothetical protein
LLAFIATYGQTDVREVLPSLCRCHPAGSEAQ